MNRHQSHLVAAAAAATVAGSNSYLIIFTPSLKVHATQDLKTQLGECKNQ
jgi:hypothetical protein